MSRYYDEDYIHELLTWEEEENESYTSDSDYYDPPDEDIQEDTPQYDDTIRDDSIVFTRWELFRLNGQTLRISNTGKVQYPEISMFHIVKGVKYEGTPYRYVNVGDKKFYVHELVWRAFNKTEPPPNYEVRHTNDTPLDNENCYLNELQYVDLYMIQVSPI